MIRDRRDRPEAAPGPALRHVRRLISGVGRAKCPVEAKLCPMPTHSETKRLPYTARQLYDLVADVSEAHDVAAENPDVVQKMERGMSEHRMPSRLFPLRPFDAEARPGSKKRE